MNILIVTSCFSPKNIIGAVRITKLAKYLVRDGHAITVISPVLEEYDVRDESLECGELDSVRRITIPYSRITSAMTTVHKGNAGQSIANSAGNQASRSCVSLAYRSLRNCFSSWRDWEWANKVTNFLRVDGTYYDVVISSYPNAATHDIARFACESGYARVWVADFRDPIVIESLNGRVRERHVRRQSDIVEAADIVTRTCRKRARRHLFVVPTTGTRLLGFQMALMRRISPSLTQKTTLPTRKEP